MKVLHVNYADLTGRRFNGYDLIDELRTSGIESSQAVLHKLSDTRAVVGILDDDVDSRLVDAIGCVERRRGMSGLMFPWGRVLETIPRFTAADVVHYHVIHNQMISLLDLPRLFHAKPSVWTFHDAWPLTGHCIQPHDCQSWMTGCSPCPHLDRPLAIDHDRAGRMWSVKKRIYGLLDVDIVVASEYMRDMVAASPLTNHFQQVHEIPFGVPPETYLPDSEKLPSRSLLGIDPDHYVLLFRSTNLQHKGLGYLIEALLEHPPLRPTTLLALAERGLLESLRHDYTIVELGWIEDEQLLPRVFSACDTFVMPSLAEGFGLMALEAMAAGRPVVCFEDTAVATVTHAPDCGVAVPMGNVVALREAIDRLAVDPEESARRGSLGRLLAVREYSHQGYLDALVSLYATAVSRPRA